MTPATPAPEDQNDDTEEVVKLLEENLAKTPLFVNLFFYGLATFVTLMIIWAWQAPLDVVARAIGEIVPTGKVQTIQHLEGGIIEHILVKEGDFVEQSQALITLQTTSQQASLDELDNRLDNLTVNKWRIMNELDEDATQMSPPPQNIDPDRAVDLLLEARLLFTERQHNIKNSIAVQNNIITQRSQEIAEEQTRTKRLEERRVLLAEQVAISERLIQDDLSNRYEHIELLKQLNTLDSAIDSGKGLIARLNTALEQARGERERSLSQFRASARFSLQETNQQLAELSERRKRLRDSLDRTILSAPVSGIVKRIFAETEGGVISPGEAVLEIVPGEDDVFVSAKLAPQDIGYVELGQEASLRLTSADAALFGNLTGTVSFISPDTIIDENGNPFYSVHINTDSKFFQSNENTHPLFPGMLIDVGINTGKRTVLQYLLAPFSQSLSFAFTER